MIFLSYVCQFNVIDWLERRERFATMAANHKQELCRVQTISYACCDSMGWDGIIGLSRMLDRWNLQYCI